MDLFGRKRITQLERSFATADTDREALRKELAAARNQIEYLVRTIRDMDQEIWNMAQKDSWPAQRPHFAKLHEGTIARKHAESNRIADILRPALIDTYAPGNAQKRPK